MCCPECSLWVSHSSIHLIFSLLFSCFLSRVTESLGRNLHGYFGARGCDSLQATHANSDLSVCPARPRAAEEICHAFSSLVDPPPHTGGCHRTTARPLPG